MIFTLIDGFLFRPLPYPNPDRIAAVWFTPPNAPPQARNIANRQNCRAVRERNKVFEHVGCGWPQTANLAGDGSVGSTPELLPGIFITADLPLALGVNPQLGRWFTQAELDTGAPVIVVSDDVWRRRYGGSSDVLGKTIRLDNHVDTIIGVMPPDFYAILPGQKWWGPLVNTSSGETSPTRIAFVAGRLKPGLTLQQAQAGMDPLAAALSDEVPQTNKGWKIRLEDLHEAFSSGAKTPLYTFQGAVALVLLIACANVAGLLLAQGAAQQKELALRSALGSSRWRIMRQLLTESVLLALVGGVFGLLVGWAGLRVFLKTLPQDALPLNQFFGLDINVLAFTFLLSIVTGLVFGILPAIQISRPDLMDALRENSRSATSTRVRQRLRSAFVVVQVALALALLISAGLLMRSFQQVTSVPVGFDYQGLTTFQVSFPQDEFTPFVDQPLPNGARGVDVSPRITQLSEQILQRLSAIPGVQSVTAGFAPPLAGFARVYNFTIQGQDPVPPPDPGNPATPAPQGPKAEWYPVMSGYFETVGVPLVRGRRLGPQDIPGGTQVVVINETAAKRYWPNDDPIGKAIKFDYYNDPIREIVGIVGDTKQNLRDKEQAAQIYVPFAQLPVREEAAAGFQLRGVTFVLRSNGNLGSIVPSMRSAAAAVLPNVATTNMLTVEEYVSRQTLDQWIYTTLLSIFGSIAVLLAIVGIYGIMAHSVSQRTGEIGVRVALGANSGEVLRLILRRGVLLIAIGIGIGVAVSLALTRVIQSVLWNVTATDPLTFSLALVGLAAAGLLACYIPARRALAIDPVIALRTE